MGEIVIEGLFDDFFIIFLESKLPKIDASEYMECVHNLIIAFTVGSSIFRQIRVLCAPLINAYIAQII